MLTEKNWKTHASPYLVELGMDATRENWGRFPYWKSLNRKVKKGETATKVPGALPWKNRDGTIATYVCEKTGKEKPVFRVIWDIPIFHVSQTEEMKTKSSKKKTSKSRTKKGGTLEVK